LKRVKLRSNAMPVGPIKPEEVARNKAAQIPEAVFKVFNALILEKIGSGHVATFPQSDVEKRLKEAGINISEAYDKGWLDVEGVYRKVGWKVVYDKPGYNESGPATFTFTKPSKQQS
jgi:hypothetical protein